MSNSRETNSLLNSSIYRININNTFLKPKSIEAKLISANPPFKVFEQNSQFINKFHLSNSSNPNKDKQNMNKEITSSLDDLFYSIKSFIFLK